MTPERWQMVRGILQSAMELRPDERAAFIDRECAADPSLRKDVTDMLLSRASLIQAFWSPLPLPRSSFRPSLSQVQAHWPRVHGWAITRCVPS
jgi:hypothetical protein